MAKPDRILPDLAAQNAALLAELAALKAAGTATAPNVSFKRSATKPSVVSAYGLGRFPVSLHAGQWLRLLDKADTIRKFIADNKVPLTKAAD